MASEMDKLIKEMKSRTESGVKIDQAIEELHRRGVSIIDTIKVLRQVYGVTLAEAKSEVTNHPVWLHVVQASQPLHDELFKILADDTGA